MGQWRQGGLRREPAGQGDGHTAQEHLTGITYMEGAAPEPPKPSWTGGRRGCDLGAAHGKALKGFHS